MKQTLCAARKICGGYANSECDGCEYGKIFVRQSRSLKNLRRKLQALREERNSTRWHTKENTVRLPALPGNDVYWIDEMCEGAPKIVCDKGAVEAICYYGDGVFKIKCKNDEPEDIGTKWCCLTYEQAEKVLEDLKK